jgi:hypothetical protein
MRKIEQLMIDALRARRNFKSGNTQVMSYPDHDAAEIRLHGHVIGVISHGKYLTLSNAGWLTPTTKSRLNALLGGLCAGVAVFQKAGVWFMVDVVTGETTEFYNGVQVEVVL